MPKKGSSPLQKLQKDGDSLKKKVDSILKDCEKYLKNAKPDLKKAKKLHKQCGDINTEVDKLHTRATDLNKEDEANPADDYDDKKEEQITRFQDMKNELNNVAERLLPEEDEEQEKKDGKKDSKKDKKNEKDSKKDKDKKESKNKKEEKKEEVIEEEDEEYEEETDDEEGDEEETEDEDEETEPKAEVKKETKAEVKTEVKAGVEKDVKRVDKKVEQRVRVEEEEYETDEEEGETEEDDDEYETDEEEGETEDEEGETEEGETDSEDSDAVTTSGTMRQFVTLSNFDAEQEGDLAFTEGEILTVLSTRDDGWMQAQNNKGEVGMVPSTYLKVYNRYSSVESPRAEQQAVDEEDEEEDDEEEDQEPKTPRSGKMLWKNIKSAVRETSVTDVLQTMGAVPPGFRQSTLAKMKLQDSYTLKAYLTPKLSPSSLSYRDMFYNPETRSIRQRNPKIQRVITLVNCYQIPPPGTVGQLGVEVKSRHVRICLFDGQSMLSNIHTIRVATVDKEERTWNFSHKVTEQTKCVDFGEVFIRANVNETTIGILFELCISYVRTSTGQHGEFSCGWVHQPLFEQDGTQVKNQTFDVFVNGGTPFEKGVDVDPSVGRRPGSSLIRSLMSGNKQPRLVFRVADATKDQKILLDTLPDVIISSTLYIQYLSFYRQLLTDALLRDTADPQSAELIHSVVLSTFPAAAENPDMMDVLRRGWAECLRTAKRAEKKDNEVMKEKFKKVFTEQVYPLYYTASLPAFSMGDPEAEKKRQTEITRLSKMSKEKKTIAACLLSADVSHQPFDVSELSFSAIGPYCLPTTRIH